MAVGWQLPVRPRQVTVSPFGPRHPCSRASLHSPSFFSLAGSWMCYSCTKRHSVELVNAALPLHSCFSVHAARKINCKSSPRRGHYTCHHVCA
jgi:hypothetical protein